MDWPKFASINSCRQTVQTQIWINEQIQSGGFHWNHSMVISAHNDKCDQICLSYIIYWWLMNQITIERLSTLRIFWWFACNWNEIRSNNFVRIWICIRTRSGNNHYSEIIHVHLNSFQNAQQLIFSFFFPLLFTDKFSSDCMPETNSDRISREASPLETKNEQKYSGQLEWEYISRLVRLIRMKEKNRKKKWCVLNFFFKINELDSCSVEWFFFPDSLTFFVWWYNADSPYVTANPSKSEMFSSNGKKTVHFMHHLLLLRVHISFCVTDVILVNADGFNKLLPTTMFSWDIEKTKKKNDSRDTYNEHRSPVVIWSIIRKIDWFRQMNCYDKNQWLSRVFFYVKLEICENNEVVWLTIQPEKKSAETHEAPQSICGLCCFFFGERREIRPKKKSIFDSCVLT